MVAAGYGGHAGYSFAVVHELKKSADADVLILVPKGYGFLVERFKSYGKVLTLPLPRKPGEGLLTSLPRWPAALARSMKLSVEHEASDVFASGSNFSVSVALAYCFLRRARVWTLEAIERLTVPSRAVRLLAMLGSRVFLHWEEQLEMYPRGEVVGPLYEPPLYEPRDEGYVLVTTGTLGHKALYDALEGLGLERAVLQTGDVDPEPYVRRNPGWRGFRYASDIHRWIAGASIVIAQQGLTPAIARLAYGKPTVVVWNPRVTLGAPKEDVKRYTEMIDAVFVDSITPASLKRSLKDAEGAGRRSPRYPVAARGVVRRILGED